MKATTKYKLNLKFLNCFSTRKKGSNCQKHHATYYFTFQASKLSNWTQKKNRLYHHMTAR